MAQKLEVGDRAPAFELPAVYGYKAGATSPSAEEGVVIKLKEFEGKKWVILSFYQFDSSPEDTRLVVSLNGYVRKYQKKEVELLGVSWNGVQSHRQFIEVYQLGYTLLADEHKVMTEKYGVIYEEDDMGQMVKRIRRCTILIDKTGMVRAIWDNIEDMRGHPLEIWEFIMKEKG